MPDAAWSPAAAHSAGLPPVTLPGYRDFVLVASGGDSVVYRAMQEGVNRPVAVKVLLGENEGVPASRYQRELEITVRLGRSHPNIVTVLDTRILPDGRGCIVMEYCELGSLQDQLRVHGPLPSSAVVAAGTVVADALAYAHLQGVLHRDVKPQNILVLPTSYVLADFGLARRIDAGHTGSLERFSYRHASPQVLDGELPTIADDIYSLGSTLFTLLDGRPPFAADEPESDSALAYLRRVRSDLPRPIRSSDATPELLAIIDRCLAKRREDRFPDATMLRDALRGVVTEARIWARSWQPQLIRERERAALGDDSPEVGAPGTPAPAQPRPAPPPAPTSPSLPPQPAPVASVPTPLAPIPASPAATAVSAGPVTAAVSPAPAPAPLRDISGAVTAPQPVIRPLPDPPYPPPPRVAPPRRIGDHGYNRDRYDDKQYDDEQYDDEQYDDERYGEPRRVRRDGGDRAGRSSWPRLVLLAVLALVLGTVLGIGGSWLLNGFSHTTSPLHGVPSYTNPLPSGALSLSTPDPALAPEITQLKDNGSSIDLVWTDPSGGRAAFTVYLNRGNASTPEFSADAGTTSATVDNLDPAKQYCFYVLAIITDANNVVSGYGISAPRCTQRP
ncbi:MAG TPA: protein kinase [Micromonosporaceae bacterium]